MLFSHSHTSTMVPGKVFFTVPVALPRANPVGMSPWSCEGVSKTKQNPSPAGEKKYQNCAIPPGFPWVLRGCPRCQPTGKQMISALISTKFCSSMKTDVD